MNKANDIETTALAIGLSLLRQPTTFRVVLGIIERRPLSEISSVYGVRYSYVQRVINKLVKEGLVVKTKVLGRVVVLPTPVLQLAFKHALRELHHRGDVSKYGLTAEALNVLKSRGGEHE
ncbi:MAG: hypothetical protein QW726_03820 [Fervidicoccaceae archaeon]